MLFSLTISGPAFSVVRQTRGGGGRRGRRGPDAKNQCYHQPIEIKLCLSHYGPKSMPDAKFESGSFPIFRDMMSQNSSIEKGTGHRIQLFTPGKWV